MTHYHRKSMQCAPFSPLLCAIHKSSTCIFDNVNRTGSFCVNHKIDIQTMQRYPSSVQCGFVCCSVFAMHFSIKLNLVACVMEFNVLALIISILDYNRVALCSKCIKSICKHWNRFSIRILWSIMHVMN